MNCLNVFDKICKSIGFYYIYLVLNDLLMHFEFLMTTTVRVWFITYTNHIKIKYFFGKIFITVFAKNMTFGLCVSFYSPLCSEPYCLNFRRKWLQVYVLLKFFVQMNRINTYPMYADEGLKGHVA